MRKNIKLYSDYILGTAFNFSYFVLNRIGIFFIMAPLFTTINRLLHLKKTKRIKKKIEGLDDSIVVSAPQVFNLLPNSGGIIFDEEFIKYKITSKKIAGSKPSNIKDFEGVAVDDALSYKEEWRHYSFYPITETIKEIAQKYLQKGKYSLLELGCGAGSIFKFVHYNDCVEYLGLDANTIALKNSPNTKNYPQNFLAINLEQEINFDYKFDVLISFEVLEHLKNEAIPNILKTIANHMRANSIFLGTASTRKMDVHLTVENEEWWFNEFAKIGLVPHPDLKEIRDMMSNNHPYNWNIATSILFAMIKK